MYATYFVKHLRVILNYICALSARWLKPLVELKLSIELSDSSDKYDQRDVDRLQKDSSMVEGYLMWRLYVVDDALKMIDESFQWRKEYGVNGEGSRGGTVDVTSVDGCQISAFLAVSQRWASTHKSFIVR